MSRVADYEKRVRRKAIERRRNVDLPEEEKDQIQEACLLECLDYIEEYFRSFDVMPKLGLLSALCGKTFWSMGRSLRNALKEDPRFSLKLQRNGSFVVSSVELTKRVAAELIEIQDRSPLSRDRDSDPESV